MDNAGPGGLRVLAPDILARPVTHAVLRAGGDEMFFCCEDPNGLLTYSLRRMGKWSEDTEKLLKRDWAGPTEAKVYGRGPDHPVGTLAARGHAALSVCPHAYMEEYGVRGGEVLAWSDAALRRGESVAKSSLELATRGLDDLGAFCGLAGGSRAWLAHPLGSEMRLARVDGRLAPMVNMDALCRRWFPPNPDYMARWMLAPGERRGAKPLLSLFGRGLDMDVHDPWVSCEFAHELCLTGSTLAGCGALPAMEVAAGELARMFRKADEPFAARSGPGGLEVYTRSRAAWSVRGMAFSEPERGGPLEAGRSVLGQCEVDKFVRDLADGGGGEEGVVVLGGAATAAKLAQWRAERKLINM
jgi:hypothetical protein